MSSCTYSLDRRLRILNQTGEGANKPIKGNWPYLLYFCILDNKKCSKGLQGHTGGPSLGPWTYRAPKMDLKIFEPLSGCICYFYIVHYTLYILAPLTMLEHFCGHCGTVPRLRGPSWTQDFQQQAVKTMIDGTAVPTIIVGTTVSTMIVGTNICLVVVPCSNNLCWNSCSNNHCCNNCSNNNC